MRRRGAGSQTIACATLHVERLHEDAVWDVLRRLLDGMERRGAKATLFVAPLRAEAVGADLGPRLGELDERGHEIGQHTHYYEWTPGTPIPKKGTMSPANIVACLDRDLAYLEARGFRPRGFVSGAWAMNDTIFDWLAAHGFHYDSSYRTYALTYDHPDSVVGDDCKRPFRRKGVVELPTTTSARAGLVAIASRSLEGMTVGDVRYHMYYTHDYDLLDWTTRSAMRAVQAMLRRPSDRFATVGELASLIDVAHLG